MNRFRKVRRKTYDDRKSTQAADGGASQALGARGNAGANPWANVPAGGIIPIYARYYGAGNAYNSNSQLNAYLQQNAYTQSAPQQLLNASQLLAQQQMQFAQMKMLMQAGVGLAATSVPTPQKPLPREIRAGEIIGYRAWILGADDSYWSTARPVQWVDGRMDGDVGTDHSIHTGVHAWKDKARAFEYAREFVGLGFDIAVGEVLLWGEVVEHADGYRAEHAEIGTIYERMDGALNPRSILNWSSSYAHIPRRPPKPKRIETDAPWAPEHKRDPITIVVWAVFAWLAAFCVSLSTGAMSPF